MDREEDSLTNARDEQFGPDDTPYSPVEKPRELPLDLPKSLDDRQHFSAYPQQETEYYDAWQGSSQFLTAPSVPTPSSGSFNLALHEPDYDDAFDPANMGNDEARIAQMLAAQRAQDTEDTGEAAEAEILEDTKLSHEQKSQALQDFLFMAASNGDAQRVQRLVRGQSGQLLHLDAVDAEGTPPLVYASCFGHREVVLALLDAGATVDAQDRNQWTALMWAMTNRHKEIAKTLLDHGASTDIKSSSGRTALDFVPPHSEMSDFLQHSGYSIGSAGVVGDDFYNAGFEQDRFEEELAENEMRRRMMMESAINLEVDLGNLGLDEQPESPEEIEEGQEFVWDRCLNDQMFVFMENDIDRILDLVVTNMTPSRSPSQKPVPANIVFLGARYAHYHASKDLLSEWLLAGQDKIYAVVDRHQWDMTILAFWISNATLLLYYLKKDPGLTTETTEFQAQMAELIHEIYILVIRDAERRMDKNIDAAMLDHETIPGFEDITFQNEWRMFKSKSKVKPEPMEKRFRPPSPKRKAQVSPRNITSLLSSTLFVLDLYDVHSVIVSQILGQLFYWLGAEIFNRIMSTKRYLARTKAMQIRMNISTLEDWARTNNRQPEQYEGNGSTNSTGETTMDSARKHLAPVVQLLQWLQCFSSLGEDNDAMETTLMQLPSLSTRQLLHAVKHYRAEVGEKTLSKSAVKYVQEVKNRPPPPQAPLIAPALPDQNSAAEVSTVDQQNPPQTPVTSTAPKNGMNVLTPEQRHPPTPSTPSILVKDADETAPQSTLMNPALLLPFHLPTSIDMLVSYGAGFGGVNRERERRYIPSVPPEFLSKLDPSGSASGSRGAGSNIYENARWSDGDSA